MAESEKAIFTNMCMISDGAVSLSRAVFAV
jgi:hypothetical protein